MRKFPLLALLLSVAYSTQIEPNRLEVETFNLSPRGLPASFDGLRIVQISDFHLGAWMNRKRLMAVCDEVQRLRPDVIVITGDILHKIQQKTVYDLTDTLGKLHAPEGIYAILGNHDHWTDAALVTRTLEGLGIHVLSNRHVCIERAGERLYLAGVDDIYERRQDLDAALDGIPPGALTLLLAHESDYADIVAADGRVAVQLSGHSHGGQVRLPFFGAIVTPPLGHKYDMGFYEVGDLLLYVNRGVGMAPYPLRLNCPPEITAITLKQT